MDWLLGTDPRTAIAVLAALVLFSWRYDKWVGGLEAQGKDRGYMAFIVALGVIVTVAGWLLWTTDMRGAVRLGLCFLASGSWMILGSIQRYQEQRAHEEAQARKEAERLLGGLDGDE